VNVRWRAPGRVNLIGEHTDYNDGFALPFAIDASCVAEVAKGPAQSGFRLRSAQQQAAFTLPYDALVNLPDEPVPGWVRYVLGPAWALQSGGHDVPPLDVLVDSSVPVGAGLSSSAAVVCSVTAALDDLLQVGLDADGLLAVSRQAENHVVGAPTGGLDQLASLRCTAGHVLFCDMRDLTTEQVPMDLAPLGLTVLVVDTATGHSHADGEYAARRTGCEAAAAQLGVPALRDVSLYDLEPALGKLDSDELRRYTRHVVTENDRVVRVAELLRAGKVLEIGPLLSLSHASMRDDYRITTPALDLAADVREWCGALGARMTGGGVGGCVIALVDEQLVDEAVEAVSTSFEREGFGPPDHFTVRPAQGVTSV
jgi:galactokinase